MKIACSAETLSELTDLKSLYEVEGRDFSSFRSLQGLKELNLFFVSWPSKKSLFWLRLALALSRRKKIVVFCEDQEKDFILSYQDKKLLLRANRIICPNLENARHGSLAQIYWQVPEKFREISYGIDLHSYCPRESLRPSENAVVAKFKAMLNFVTKKIIKKDKANILVAGRREDCQEYLEVENLQAKFEYLFPSENDETKKIKTYQANDIFLVIDKKSAGQVQKIIEALACGLCILAPRSGKFNNIFDHDKQGLFFKPDDHEDLLEKLALLCRDEEKRENMALEARKLAENHYNKKLRNEKIKAIVKELGK